MNAQMNQIEPRSAADDLTDKRLELAKSWLDSIGVSPQAPIRSVAGDASFRRYFRIKTSHTSLILMDAPPPAEDVRPFIDVAKRLQNAGLHAPAIIHSDAENGFLLLEDLGDDMYRDLLNPDNADQWFPELFTALAGMAKHTDCQGLSDYNADKLRFELDLLPKWYLKYHRPLMPRAKFDAIWEGFCAQILASAFEQPQCFVHRDFHSSNLLKAPDGSIGIIDFQDAVYGPVSYDFISLVWDRYISWPRDRIEQWMEDMRQRLDLDMPAVQWRRYCDLMGLQRNIKIVGIFARLYYRDGKHGYIEMIPRFYEYVLATLRLYPEFSEMLEVLEHEHCVP